MNPSLNEVKPKIFIAGLSWARGEWVGPNVVHQGIEQYFVEDGYTVFNVAKPRTTHNKINTLLDQALAEHYSAGDLIFWVQADPIIDLIHQEIPGKLTNQKLQRLSERLQQENSLLNLIIEQQRIIYCELNNIAVKHNTKINCIGGTYNIGPVIAEFSNLNNFVPSWINMLVGHFTEYARSRDDYFGVTHTWTIDNIDINTYNISNSVQQEIKERNDNVIMFREDIFHPDGVHPNRDGHRVLYDYIKKELIL
jgi:lysophospholipase L1-like esterase